MQITPANNYTCYLLVNAPEWNETENAKRLKEEAPRHALDPALQDNV